MKQSRRTGTGARVGLRFAKWPLAAAAAAFANGAAYANPVGPQVVDGPVSFSTPDASTLQIDQGDTRAVINWQSFSIASGETVRFVQPVDGTALNRVVGGPQSPLVASQILGRLEATGRVFLVNPQGVVFGKGAVVDVGALVASTLDIGDADFLDGDDQYSLLRPSASAPAAVINHGSLQAGDGGFVVLAGTETRNTGLIQARLGTVALLSGDALTLALDDAGLVAFAIDQPSAAAQAGATNLGDLIANGGRVVMAAGVARQLVSDAVNNSGRISAQSIVEQDGSIYLGAALLQAEGGDLVNAGSIDAAGAVDGGSVSLFSDNGITRGTDPSLPGSISAGGDISVFAFGDVSTGALDAPRIDVSAGGAMILGDLTAQRADQGTRITLAASDDIQLGAIRMEGHLASTTPESLSSGADLRVSSDFGGIEVRGPVQLLGTMDNASGGDELFVRGAFAGFTALSGGVHLAQDVRIEGHIGSIDGGDFLSALGAHLDVASGPGLTALDGTLRAVGSIDRATAGSFGDLRGAAVVVTALSDVDIGGSVEALGNVGTVSAGSDLLTMGAHVFLQPEDAALNIAGAVRAQGTVASVTGGDAVDARGAEADLGVPLDDPSRGLTDFVQVGGGIVIDGRLDQFSAGSDGSAVGGYLLASALFGQELAALEVSGHVGTVSAQDDLATRGAYAELAPGFGDIHVGGAVRVLGDIDSIDAGLGAFVSGARFYVHSLLGGVQIDGDLTASGALNRVAAGDALFVSAVDLTINLDNGSIAVTGDLGVTGTADTASGGDDSFFNGVFMDLTPFGGDVHLQGDLQASGALGAITAGTASSASGAQLVGLPDGHFIIDGSLGLDGSVARFSADTGSGVFGADAFLFSGTALQRGDTVIHGPLNVSGRVGAVTGGDGLYALGAFASLLSFQGEVALRGGARVSGTIGAVSAGNDAEATGAGLWLEAGSVGIAAGSVHTQGSLTVNGEVASLAGGSGVSGLGALAYLSANDGSVTLDGAGDALQLRGTVGSARGTDRVSASGSQLLIERQGDDSLAGALGDRIDLNVSVSQQGTVGSFTAGDPASSEVSNGGVLIDAGDGGVSFGTVQGEDIYVYFDADSTLQDGSLTANHYLEIVTPSFGPTLTAHSLSLSAPEVFISANLDAATLTASGRDSLVVFAAALQGGELNLGSEGIVRLNGIGEDGAVTPTSLRAEHLRISGGSILGDRATSLTADSVDLIASDTLFLAGAVAVGEGLADDPGDTGLIERLAFFAPELLPTSARPNAYFRAPTVALAELSLGGDYVHIQADFIQLGQLTLPAGTLFHVDPLTSLPFFTESVDVTDAGLDSIKGQLATEGNRITPNLGRFNDGQGGDNLGDRPVIGSELRDSAGDAQFSTDPTTPNLSQLILEAGLADTSIALGSSDFGASLQISDQLAVDVRPSATNFLFMTTSNILIAQPILTNGKVVVLQGNVLSDPAVFYAGVRDEFMAFAQAQAEAAEQKEGEVEEKTREEGEDCQ